MVHRRTLTLAATIAAIAELISSGHAGVETKKPQPKAGTHHEAFDKCAKACNDCQRICDACATHCAHLIAQGKKEHVKTLQTCRDCADFCSAAAEIVARNGPFADLICKSCAEACNRCGKACDEFKDDDMMRKCAEECFRCEKACQEMLQHVGQLDNSSEAGAIRKERGQK
jgi:hypothetical protein